MTCDSLTPHLTNDAGLETRQLISSERFVRNSFFVFEFQIGKMDPAANSGAYEFIYISG